MFNLLQAEYLAARAAASDLTEQALALAGEYTGPEDDEQALAAYVEREAAIYQKLGLIEALARQHDAEEALLAWLHDLTRQLPGYDDEIRQLFNTPTLRIRRKVISLALRISPRPAAQGEPTS